VKPTH